jgi:hypothetical protein
MDITEIAMLGAGCGFVISHILQKIKLKKSIMKFADPILSVALAFFMLWIFKDSSLPQTKEILIACTASIFNNFIISDGNFKTKSPLLNLLLEKTEADKDKEKIEKEK